MLHYKLLSYFFSMVKQRMKIKRNFEKLFYFTNCPFLVSIFTEIFSINLIKKNAN